MAIQKLTDVTIYKPEKPVGFLGKIEQYWRSTGFRKDKIDRLTPNNTKTSNQLLATLQKYKWRGAEFGNWTSQDDRNTFVVAFIESSDTVAKLLGFNQLGMEYTIGVAFGARGKGKAAAHFEPNTFMINLTKENGFGAFAHEYGHALDYFFGTFIEQEPGRLSLSGGSSTRRNYMPDRAKPMAQATCNLINAIIQNGNNLSESYQRWDEYADSDYWLRRNEIFARWFEQYIHHLLDKKGKRNTYLTKDKYSGVFYLTPADFKRVLPLGNKLFKLFQEKVNS
ncbi:MAG TPA: hypothetical protein PK239_14715 [Chitinophagales bacterium]|nr:hypothetical protein [Chitinophagales bacterium]HRK28526.1 hypothetical protein [Chitinophagales bacterium]